MNKDPKDILDLEQEAEVSGKKRKKAAPEKQQIAESFEEAVERLSVINADLQSGKLPLEEALKKYEEAIQLREYATEMLAGAKIRIAVAGEKKATAAFRMQLSSVLSEFEETVVESFREKRELPEEQLQLLWSKIKALMSEG